MSGSLLNCASLSSVTDLVLDGPIVVLFEQHGADEPDDDDAVAHIDVVATNGKGTGLVGYNVQTSVDGDSHIFVAHEVTNLGHDRTQFASMGRQAKDATGAEHLTALAVRGYFSGAEILACEDAGATPICPQPSTSGAKAEGPFGKSDFLYDPPCDTYR